MRHAFASIAFRVGLAVLAAGSLPAQDPALTPDGFAIPQPGRHFVLPRDHGNHPEFRMEWWYVTGHLRDTEGRRYGFQGTFFRKASGDPQHGIEQLYLADAALLDVRSGRFICEEKLNREGTDAGSSVSTLDVRNANWSLRLDRLGHIHLTITLRGEALLQLTLKVTNPLVIFGENGVSRKGAAPSAASHYLTYPRLAVTGSFRLDNATDRAVQGQAWMDHEFSSSQLDEGQVGWDWSGIQLDDGAEIMVYRMRRADGSPDPASTLAWVGGDGRLTQTYGDAFGWRSTGAWHSPRTGANYPNHVQITATGPESGHERTFKLRPLAEDQELSGAISGLPYWEGACDVTDEQDHIVGKAFLELAGYAGDLAGRLRK